MRPMGGDTRRAQMKSPWGHVVVKAFVRRNVAHLDFREGLVYHREQNKHQNLSPAKVMVRWRAFIKASIAYEAVKREGNVARAMAFATSGAPE